MVSELIESANHHKQDNCAVLSYFADDVKRIALEILSGGEERQEYQILNLARRCHQQAIADGGLLHCDRFFNHVRQEKISVPISTRSADPNIKYEATVNQGWINFWNEALCNCPAPVLFKPHASPLFSSRDFQLDKVPRYLFRTFDRKSFGRTDENIVASPASEIRTVSSKFDIFSLDTDLAMSIVDRHMNPWRVKDYDKHAPDNLMSWTSSLLYAVQYALYRRHHYGCASDEIKICVADTTKFDRGQFVHARRLLQAYYDLVRQADMRQNFDTRLLVYIYQNGEYLSQGTLYHAGRSCVISLAALEESGLYSLYPEFAVPHRQAKWAITTAHLRKLWTEQHVSSTYRELEVALSLARTCFVGLNVLEIAIIFLSFKRRKLKRVRGEIPGGDENYLRSLEEHIPEWGRKPQEVRQYLAALRVLRPNPRVLDDITEEIYPMIGSIAAETDGGLIQVLLKCFSILL
ncbi:hypothetical protein BJY01DRAFT_262766 [Aspergillus pseudoustus]|uniref:DUF7587 domain-containing protein n=1 Tax=Aspergillus pseudoustus TaxID=1810923 RepID=A0ABR4K7A9_9EURO